jgi:cell wall-associated NlpC family hydrolase
MPALVAGIHVFLAVKKAWMAGTSPAMTTEGLVTLDPRVNAYRPDLAASHLRGQVEAAQFVDGVDYEVVEPIADLRRTPLPDAALDTQALYGERVTIYETTDEGWAWGQLAIDGYVGWFAANALAKPGLTPTHTVIVPRTLAFPAADIKQPPLAAPPMGAALTVSTQDERFAVTANGWHIPAMHVAPLGSAYGDFVSVAEMFLGTPYLWGGKSTLGIDCSGLVQIALQAAGRMCPRDSDMQEASLGAPIALNNLRRGDLLFWPGHVAIACASDAIVHANAHHMMVAREPVEQALTRIMKAGSELRAVKRPS